MKSARVSASMVMIVLLASTGGCVMKSTHDAVLAELGGTQTRLQQSQADNLRLRGGLEALAGGLDATAVKVETIDSSVRKLRTEGDDVAARLAGLRALVAEQVNTITALGQALKPLKDQIEALRAHSAALSGQAPAAGPAGPAPTAPGPVAAAPPAVATGATAR